MDPILLEICVDDLAGARAAIAGGADRLEVCADLFEEGLTPHDELVHAIRAEAPLPLFAMVRPRPTDFVAQDGEWDELRRDLHRIIELEVQGVVLGILSAQYEIPDQELGRLLEDLPEGMSCTFHRAFDHVADPEQAIARLASVGVTRILTSGRPGRAIDHLRVLESCAEQCRNLGTIQLLPGGGVRPNNADKIVAATQCVELHSSSPTGWAAWRQARDAR